MSKRAKKTSELLDTDEVAVMLAAKIALNNNVPSEIKKASAVILTWHAAKSVLAVGNLEGRKVSLLGFVADKPKGENATIEPLNDDLYDDGDDSNNSENAFGEASQIAMEELLKRMEAMQKTIDKFEKKGGKLPVEPKVTPINTAPVEPPVVNPESNEEETEEEESPAVRRQKQLEAAAKGN